MQPTSAHHLHPPPLPLLPAQACAAALLATSTGTRQGLQFHHPPVAALLPCVCQPVGVPLSSPPACPAPAPAGAGHQPCRRCVGCKGGRCPCMPPPCRPCAALLLRMRCSPVRAAPLHWTCHPALLHLTARCPAPWPPAQCALHEIGCAGGGADVGLTACHLPAAAAASRPHAAGIHPSSSRHSARPQALVRQPPHPRLLRGGRQRRHRRQLLQVCQRCVIRAMLCCFQSASAAAPPCSA